MPLNLFRQAFASVVECITWTRSPQGKGFGAALGGMCGLTAALYGLGFLLSIRQGSAVLFRDLGHAAIGLLIAYSVATAGGGETLRKRLNHNDHQDWLGFVIGTGVCGLLGAGLAFGLAQHRMAGHSNLVDEIGLAWVVASVGILGLIVAVLPLAFHHWQRPSSRDRWRIERLKSEAVRLRGPAA